MMYKQSLAPCIPIAILRISDEKKRKVAGRGIGDLRSWVCQILDLEGPVRPDHKKICRIQIDFKKMCKAPRARAGPPRSLWRGGAAGGSGSQAE